MILLKNVWLNDKEKDVLIEGNLISKIADKIDNNEAKIIYCKDKAIVPSFCNTHNHASMMFLRGIGEDKELFAWLNEDIWPREAKLSPEMIYHLSRFAILEMIKSGTTMFSDMYFYPQGTMRAVDEMGVRAAVSVCGMDFFNEETSQKELQKMYDFMAEENTCERIIKGLSCHAIYTVSQNLFLKAKELSDKHNTFLHIHSSETRKEVDDCLEQYHCPPVVMFNKWGVLGEKTILAHCLHLDDCEINTLRETKTIVSHCPSSSLKLNSGQMDLQKLLDSGLRVTLGTDGVSSNNSLSMLSEMKIAALSAKNRAHNIGAAKVNDVFDIATRNGFEAFDLNAGQINEGCLADFVLVDLNNVFLLPNHNLISNMIYSADSSCITDVFCNGVPVMFDRVVPHEDEIISEFKKIVKTLG